MTLCLGCYPRQCPRVQSYIWTLDVEEDEDEDEVEVKCTQLRVSVKTELKDTLSCTNNQTVKAVEILLEHNIGESRGIDIHTGVQSPGSGNGGRRRRSSNSFQVRRWVEQYIPGRQGACCKWDESMYRECHNMH